MVNVGNAVSTFTAQNIGGKKPERVKEGFRAGLLMSAVIGVIVTGILLVYAKVFVGLFMDSSPIRRRLPPASNTCVWSACSMH